MRVYEGETNSRSISMSFVARGPGRGVLISGYFTMNSSLERGSTLFRCETASIGAEATISRGGHEGLEGHEGRAERLAKPSCAQSSSSWPSLFSVGAEVGRFHSLISDGLLPSDTLHLHEGWPEPRLGRIGG